MRYPALEAAGPGAAHIAANWWLLFWVCLVVYLLVIAALLIALRRGRPADAEAASEIQRVPNAPRERLIGFVIAISVGVSAIILIIFLAASVITGRALASLSGKENVAIEITGYRWWWKVEYTDLDPSQRMTSANEIHIPVGSPVKLTLKSYDVIHSLWVPELHGKRDLIPGHPNVLRIQADRPGVYYGQCAEFCGLQHAHMRLVVVAEPADKFAAWLAGQREPAKAPTDDNAKRGQQVFLSRPCAFCHNISGTEASGKIAPDLTHVASRLQLGAGAIPNTPGHLAGWILDSQHIKPGNSMPSISLSGDELAALIAYLGGLS